MDDYKRCVRFITWGFFALAVLVAIVVPVLYYSCR